MRLQVDRVRGLTPPLLGHTLLPLGGAAAAAGGVSAGGLLVLADRRLCLPATIVTVIVTMVFLVERH